ncbi:MAG: CapA family protein [Chloroflexi bacterium]|nr:CapA family protein [Chloroflexota bacterium]
MLFEAESGSFALATTGDSMITRKMSVFREDRFLALVKLLRGADVAYTNLEMLFHQWEGTPAVTGGTYTASHPSNLEELKWMGFKIVSCANNHAYDWGEVGLLTTIANLDKAGLVHCGTGRNLAEARAPAYLDTPRGRVALLSVTSTIMEQGRAADQRSDMHGRPGVSALGHQVTYSVDRRALEDLRRVSTALGFEEEKEYRRRFGFAGPQPQEGDTELYFLDRKFALGEEFGVRTGPNQRDMQDILRWVREARRMADWVVLSLHNHESGRTRWDPADFVVQFAHRCIDEGVDIFAGHGPHHLRGIEIYKGKPIYYSLGHLIFQNETIHRIPQDAYTRFGLGYDNTPADFFEARSGTTENPKGFAADPIYSESAIAVNEFRQGRLEGIRLYPVDLGMRRPRSQRGRPVLADAEAGPKTLERMRQLCAPFGAEVRIKDNVGYITP